MGCLPEVRRPQRISLKPSRRQRAMTTASRPLSSRLTTICAHEKPPRHGPCVHTKYVLSGLYRICYCLIMMVYYYESAMGSTPVLDYLLALPVQDSAPIFALLQAIGTYGLEVADRRHIRGKLWEFRPHRHRIFYAVLRGDVWLFHAYKKQGAKAPPREIKFALRRLKEIDN